jgi:hypothetical protein
MASDAFRWSTCQQVAFTGSSVAITNAFGAQTYWIRLSANAACHVKIGDGTQTAATTDPFLPANWVTYVTVTPGQKLAAIRASTDGLVTATSGTLSVTELS